MAASSRTIVLRGKDKGHHDEGILDTVASPGMHVQRASDDHYDKSGATAAELVKHGLKIVKEDDYQGKTVSDDYAIGDVVFIYIPVRGDRINVLVKSGENIAIGDKITPEGGGTGLFIEAAGTEATYLLEAVEAPGALGANTLVACEVLN